jgi:hypothetical protein
MQIYTKFSNFTGLYFPHFKTIRNPTLQFFRSSCPDKKFVYSWNHPFWISQKPHPITVYCPLGHYMFLEASNPQREGHQARLISPEVNVRRACLVFFYHMWGSECGSLKVKFLTKGGYMDEFTWEREGNQGQRWIKAEVNVRIGLTYQVMEPAYLKVHDIKYAAVHIQQG